MRTYSPTRSLITWATLAGLLGGGAAACAQQRAAARRAPARPAPVVRQAAPVRGGGLQAPARGAGFQQTPARGAGFQQTPAPIERRGPAAGSNAPASQTIGPNPAGARDPKGHLREWMAQHGNLSGPQQQQALEREPGFRQLPQEQQQHMRDRLNQLNAMPPEQRQRILAHNEAMERLSPEQRSQVRGAMSQLGSLPPDQRQSVARSFREIRQMPANQRFAAMNSSRYSYLNPTQRQTLNNLIRVEPMLPPPEPPQPR